LKKKHYQDIRPLEVYLLIDKEGIFLLKLTKKIERKFFTVDGYLNNSKLKFQ
jgi:hypothetical protein